MDCPPGTLFDTNKNICDFPYKALCFDGQTGQTVYENLAGQKGQTWQKESHGQNRVVTGTHNGYNQGRGTYTSGYSESPHQAAGVHSGVLGGNVEGYRGGQPFGSGFTGTAGTNGFQHNINSNIDFQQETSKCNSAACSG